jgi:hypothetical protein
MLASVLSQQAELARPIDKMAPGVIRTNKRKMVVLQYFANLPIPIKIQL